MSSTSTHGVISENPSCALPNRPDFNVSNARSAGLLEATTTDRWGPPSHPHTSPNLAFGRLLEGVSRRLHRERRRRSVGRAYDMALEIARVIPPRSEVLDVGCGNGFIAHHLSAMLGRSVVGIDLGSG